MLICFWVWWFWLKYFFFVEGVYFYVVLVLLDVCLDLIYENVFVILMCIGWMEMFLFCREFWYDGFLVGKKRLLVSVGWLLGNVL